MISEKKTFSFDKKKILPKLQQSRIPLHDSYNIQHFLLLIILLFSYLFPSDFFLKKYTRKNEQKIET